MNRKKIILILAALLLITLFFMSGAGQYLTLEALKANRQWLTDYRAGHGTLVVCLFMALYILQTALSLPGAAIMSLAAGALFGPVMGTLYAVIAASIGACLAFVVSRYLLRDAVLKRYGGRLERLNREMELRGLNYLLFLRLVPLFPFFLVNLAAGVTRMRLRTFIIGTVIGIIPGGFVYVNAGSSLAAIEHVGDILTLRVLGSFALLGLSALVPVLYGKLRKVG